MYSTLTAQYNRLEYNSLGETEETYSAGSEGVISLLPEGGGEKKITAGELANLKILAEGSGAKSTAAGSAPILKIGGEGAGEKLAAGGSEAALIISGEGTGFVTESRLFAGFAEAGGGEFSFSLSRDIVFAGYAQEMAGAFDVIQQIAARISRGHAGSMEGQLIRVAKTARSWSGYADTAVGQLEWAKSLQRLYQGYAESAEGSYTFIKVGSLEIKGYAGVSVGIYIPVRKTHRYIRGYASRMAGSSAFLDVTATILRVVNLEASLETKLRQDFYIRRQDHTRVAYDLTSVPYADRADKFIWKVIDDYGHILIRKEAPGDMRIGRFELNNREALYFDLDKEDTDLQPGKYTHELKMADVVGNPSTIAKGTMRIYPSYIDLT